MLFVKTYAKVSIFLALAVAIYSIWSLKNPNSGSYADALLIMTQTIWALASVAALLVFPSYKAPMWAPCVFLIYCVSHVFVDFVVAMTFPTIHNAPWATALKGSPLLVHGVGLAFSTALLILNALLLRHRLPTHPEAPPS